MFLIVGWLAVLTAHLLVRGAWLKVNMKGMSALTYLLAPIALLISGTYLFTVNKFSGFFSSQKSEALLRCQDQYAGNVSGVAEFGEDQLYAGRRKFLFGAALFYASGAFFVATTVLCSYFANTLDNSTDPALRMKYLIAETICVAFLVLFTFSSGVGSALRNAYLPEALALQLREAWDLKVESLLSMRASQAETLR
ncbi:hypothetical protein ACJZTR_00365 [Neorickettsia risticii]|uniref:hypothetical protein n=1 Tax=Neorickettsia risticii TaxID=950 RepID=UPI0011D0C36E|nr:hypothetical protein [Neorickettsia risticii]